MGDERVVLTGLGIVSALGRGLEATLRALREDQGGLGALTLFPSPRNGHQRVAEVRGLSSAPRTLALARLAVSDALAAARLPYPRERIALVLGTCVGGMPESDVAVASALAEQPFGAETWRHHPCGWTTATLAIEFELGGHATTISNACSSGAQAMAHGSELLAAGLADAVVAGGADALCRLTLNGFASLLAMDPLGARPFDRARAGMSLGEGAAFCVLERAAEARARGTEVWAELASSANTCDAHHATAPEPEGRGAEAAMRLALERARVRPEEIDYVNAHGTGTRDNDLADGRALARLFGARPPALSSVKGAFGHTLGAVGAIEALVCALALRHGFLPGTVGLSEVDPECGVRPLARATPARARVALSNSFGFGGNNTVLVLRAP